MTTPLRGNKARAVIIPIALLVGASVAVLAATLVFTSHMSAGLAVALLLLVSLTAHLAHRAIQLASKIEENAAALSELNEGLEQRVLERTTVLEATLANISQGILMLGPTTEILVSNKRALELLDVTDRSGLAAAIPTLLVTPTGPAKREQRTRATRYDVALPSGRILEVAQSAIETGGLVLTLTDITVLKRRQAELETATQAAHAASRTKSQFLSTMSHEMRTPLNGVIGALDLLGRTALEADQKKLVDTALVSGEALLAHINDVLDFSKLEAGKLELHPGPFDVRGLVETVLKIVGPQATHRNTKLASKIGEGVPGIATADSERLRQILLNLAGNAAKFTHNGVVSVEVARVGGTDEMPDIEFSVTDTGPGIPEDRLPSMFQEFSMLDTSYSRREGGTGLGLAICKRLVSAMGGTIGVTSKVGEGSRFWFRITIERAMEFEIKREEPAAPAAIRNLDLLLVDDSSVNLMIGTQMLAAAGHKVETATNGLEAVAAASKKRYDAILMDISMPEMDGIEATKCIRLLEEPLRSVPIVALTANAIAGDKEHFLAAGMNDYLTKPYRRADLERVLARISPSAPAFQVAS